MKALFLGAGASYECGMPLVWEFTNGLRANVLKRLESKLFDFRSLPAFRAEFESILSDPDIHYEQMIAKLESIQLQRGPASEIARVTARQLLDCVQVLLLEDQVLTTSLLAEKAKDYSGLRRLLEAQSCLDVFSLNHDINFEEICKLHGVECRDGFYEGGADRYTEIANFKSLSIEQIESGRLNLFDGQGVGVSLLKLHGSLDVFAVEDKRLYLKCTPPVGAPIGGHVAEIRRVEEKSMELSRRLNIRTVGELDVLDAHGELQFLRRSLLSGGHKFKGTFDQVAPNAFFEEFKKRMSDVTDLDVIGYGFGDDHVNQVLLQWLDTPGVVMTIYDPLRREVPLAFSCSANKVLVSNLGLTGYFQKLDPPKIPWISESRNAIFERGREGLRQRRLAQWQRSSA
ncbi:hypothetical protein D3C77_199780 [compost metagenome]